MLRHPNLRMGEFRDLEEYKMAMIDFNSHKNEEEWQIANNNYNFYVSEWQKENLKIKKEKKMSEKNGIYTNKLTEKTPEWIVCKIGIKVDELPKPNDKGFINIDICKSKDGSYYYAKLNDYGLIKENITNAEEINIDNFNF